MTHEGCTSVLEALQVAKGIGIPTDLRDCRFLGVIGDMRERGITLLWGCLEWRTNTFFEALSNHALEMIG